MSREVRSKAYVNGQPAARFKIVKKGEANAIEVIRGIRQRFDQMVANGELPTGMELFWFTDSEPSSRRRSTMLGAASSRASF